MKITKKYLGAIVQYSGTSGGFKVEGFENGEGKTKYMYGTGDNEGRRPVHPEHPEKKYYLINGNDADYFTLIKSAQKQKVKEDSYSLRVSCRLCPHEKVKQFKLSNITEIRDFLENHSDVKIDVVTKEKTYASHH